ncbi:hypothetical protein OG216_47085 (plasmid) [Streptomycetaceae bacterium NBC_01309]
MFDPRPRLEADDPERFKRVWRRFTDRLRTHAPDSHATLRPGATPEQLVVLKTRLGFAPHPQLAALLALHNGASPVAGRPSNASGGGFLPFGHRLSDVDAIVRASEATKDQAADLGQPSVSDLVADADADADDEFADEGLHDSPEAHVAYWVPLSDTVTGAAIFVDHRPGPCYGHVYEIDFANGGMPEFWAVDVANLFGTLTDTWENGGSFRGHRPAATTTPEGRRVLDWEFRN